MSHVKTRVLAIAVLILATVLGVSVSPSAQAAYPGKDGKIAFTRANQIYTIKADGSGLTQLTTNGKNYRPRYSPNGKQIAYVHETADGYRDIWLMRADGSNQRRLTRVGDVAGASWAPDGKALAFAGGQDLELEVIYRYPDGWGRPSFVRAYFCDDPPFGQLQRLPVRGAVAWSSDDVLAYTMPGSCDSPDSALADHRHGCLSLGRSTGRRDRWRVLRLRRLRRSGVVAGRRAPRVLRAQPLRRER